MMKEGKGRGEGKMESEGLKGVTRRVVVDI